MEKATFQLRILCKTVSSPSIKGSLSGGGRQKTGFEVGDGKQKQNLQPCIKFYI